MSHIKNDSFSVADNAIANLGDNIQALAIDSIYQQLNIDSDSIEYIKRDFACEYQGEPLDLLLYSEFAKSNIVSRLNFCDKVHLNAVISAVFYDDFETLNAQNPSCYHLIKSMEPIGCRDEKTTNYLRSQGIEAYLMGCFTVCFPKREKTPNHERVFLIDIPQELEPFIPTDIKANCEYLSQATPILKYPVDLEEDKRLDEEARKLLKRYAEEATLVVTGRLHAAIPCLAMGIPVILACNNIDFRFGWIEKFIRPYQLSEYHQINWSPDVVEMKDLKSMMLTLFDKAIRRQDIRHELKWLDQFYSSRNKVQPYKNFRQLIKLIDGKYNQDNSFSYIIWGAGYHCTYAYELLSQQFPNARLVAVVDKFKRGSIHSVPIISESQLSEYSFDHLVITTVPGTPDALAWREKSAPELAYTILTSQHKS